LLSKYKWLKYDHNKTLIEMNKYDFIFFIKKIIIYDNTLKKFNTLHNYKEDQIKTLHKCINKYHWINPIKTEENIESFIFGKNDHVEEAFHYKDPIGDGKLISLTWTFPCALNRSIVLNVFLFFYHNHK